MTLRPLDAAGRRAYLQDLRPRLLTLAVDSGRMHLRWCVPAWAIEEPLRFLVRAGSLAIHVAPRLHRRWPDLAARLPSPLRSAAAHPGPGDLFRQVDAWFSEAHRDLLSLPDGSPLLDVTTAGARVVVRERRL